MLYRAGGNRSLMIMALIWVGLALFVGLVWVLYRRPPWSLSKETWTVILSSWIYLVSLDVRTQLVFPNLVWLSTARWRHCWFTTHFFVTRSLILRSIVPVLIVRGVFKKEPNAFGYRPLAH